MKSIDIVLGEKIYTVTQLPLRQNVAWQRNVAVQAKPILSAIPGLMGALQPIIKQAALPVMVVDDIATGTAKAVELTAPATSWLDRITDETLPALLDTGSGLLIGALDAMPVLLDLIYEFDKALKLDEKFIEANVSEEEFLTAFVAIVKMSFPFGAKILDILKSLNATTASSGGTTATTSPTSPSQNGDDGTTISASSSLPA